MTRADPEKGLSFKESLKEREWRESPKRKELKREAHVLKSEATVRWFGRNDRVGWRSMKRKSWRERGEEEWAEMRAVHETRLGDGIWWKRRRV